MRHIIVWAKMAAALSIFLFVLIGMSHLVSVKAGSDPVDLYDVPSSSSEMHGKRSKRSPLVSSSSSFMEGATGGMYFGGRMFGNDNFENQIGGGNEIDQVQTCRKRTLAMCKGHVPFNSTTYPNLIGDNNELEASRSIPYFNYIAKSRCNRRIKQLLCTFLEPECQGGQPLPPCKKFCRIALEGCAEFIPQTLELSSAFDCRRYPDSTDPRVCVNLAVGPKCAADEFQCPDRSCIPRNWMCDGVRDCIFAADEANCNTVACSSEEFECDRKCVPASWRCDGDRDCADGTDELNCSYKPGCGPDRFKCSDGFGCIPKRWVCDGKAECRDGSDELSCSQKQCTSGDFKCDNGICIPGMWVCDGQDDCKDNSDEKTCSGLAPVKPAQRSLNLPQTTVPAPTSSHSNNHQNSYGNQQNYMNHNYPHNQQQQPQHQGSLPVGSNSISSSNSNGNNNGNSNGNSNGNGMMAQASGPMPIVVPAPSHMFPSSPQPSMQPPLFQGTRANQYQYSSNNMFYTRSPIYPSTVRSQYISPQVGPASIRRMSHSPFAPNFYQNPLYRYFFKK